MSDIGPGVRQAFRDACKEHLYKKTHLELKTELNAIILENSLVYGNTSPLMSYRGKLYRSRKPERKEKAPYNLLTKGLRERMKAYLDAKEAADRDEALGMGFILKVLGRTDRLKDLYALLPDSLHGVIGEFSEHFIEGEGRFSPTDIAEFLANNDHYVKLLKARMLYNLIDAGR